MCDLVTESNLWFSFEIRLVFILNYAHACVSILSIHRYLLKKSGAQGDKNMMSGSPSLNPWQLWTTQCHAGDRPWFRCKSRTHFLPLRHPSPRACHYLNFPEIERRKTTVISEPLATLAEDMWILTCVQCCFWGQSWTTLNPYIKIHMCEDLPPKS